MHRRSGWRLSAVALAALSIALLSLESARSAGKAAGPRLSEARILAIARAAATGEGDSMPVLIEHAYGTREQLTRIDSGARVPDSSWSILIVVLGHFVDRAAKLPRGPAPPAGIEISLIDNVASGQNTDFGIGHRIPDLSRLAGHRIDYLDHAEIAEVTGVIRPGATGRTVPRHSLAGLVTVFSAHGTHVTAQSVRKGHAFRFFLLPGTYEINVGSRLRSGSDCRAKRITVGRGRVVHVNVFKRCRST